MISSNDQTGKLALDTAALGDLRQSARAGSPEALKTAATQFEAMFINMMMKSMRDATPQDGLLDSQQSKTFTTMLDQQTSQNLAKKGMGLADVLIRQLSQGGAALDSQALALGSDSASAASAGAPSMSSSLLDAARLQRAIAAAGGGGTAATASTPAASATTASTTTASATTTGAGSQQPHVRRFQDKLAAHAEAASAATGIPAKFMLGQAALETGWGKREIKARDGSNSHNLFGIKAGADWKGKVAEAVTTEYVNGKAQTRVERFRAYASYADSFKDYGRLLSKNPRYEKVLASASAGDAASFARGLQRAGYATDPHYASKLSSIIKHSLVG